MDKENIKEYVKREKEILDKEFELVEQLCNLRKEHNISQQLLANIIGTKQPQIVRVEKRLHSPQLNTLLKILDVYGYTIEFKKTGRNYESR